MLGRTYLRYEKNEKRKKVGRVILYRIRSDFGVYPGDDVVDVSPHEEYHLQTMMKCERSERERE